MDESKIDTETVAITEAAEVASDSAMKSAEALTKSNVHPVTDDSALVETVQGPSENVEPTSTAPSHVSDGVGRLIEAISADKLEYDDISLGSESDYDDDGDDVDSEWEEDRSKEHIVPLSKRKQFFDPNDSTAVHLKTDSQHLVLTKLPEVSSKHFKSEVHLDTEPNTSIVVSAASNEFVSLQRMESFEDEKEDETERDFFKKLGRVPNIEDISLASAEDVQSKKASIESQVGRFVHPLTGIYTPDNISPEEEVDEEESEKPETQTSGVGEEIVEDEDQYEFSFDDFDEEFEEEKKTKKEEQTQEGDMLDILLKKELSEGKMIFRNEEIDEEVLKARKLAENTDKFLNELLGRVIVICENQENTKVVRHSLDKKKMIREIAKVACEYKIEDRVREFLARKALEYYRRRKLFRYILPEKQDQAVQEYEKYREANYHLDVMLGQQIAMIKKNDATIERLSIEGDEMEEDAKLEEQKFKQMVRNTFKKEGMSHLAEVVEKELRTLSLLYEEISQVRWVLIMRQHSLGRLKSKLDDLENIGDGLRVADYESLERETIALGKKMEERSYDLSRYHEEFNTTLHTLAHSKLRCEMVLDKIKVQAITLGGLEDEKTKCRLRVYELKMKRQKIYRQTCDVSIQNGIVSKPALMLDYDVTFEHILERRKSVEKFRQIHRELEQKYKRVELLLQQEK